MFNFEKLDVWNEAIEFADFVYSVTRSFPDEERFGLTNQMRRDFARFVELATGSLFEVVSQATVGKRQRFLSEEDYNRLYSACEKQSKMLSGLRRSLVEH